MDKRIVYSQNFLVNKTLVSELIAKSSVTNEDIVYEIGAGEGIITEELLKKAKEVIAFEIDTVLFNKLTKKFQNEKRVDLKFGNFLNFDLPNLPYKIFSNIPFNITSEVIKKITQSENPPDDAYLVVQKEAAEKFMGNPFSYENSLVAILLKPWFDFEIVHNFKPNDFFPRPNVKIVLLRIIKKNDPIVDYKEKRIYEDFVTYVFNGTKPLVVKNKKPSELDFKEWIKFFNDFKDYDLVEGSYEKMLREQANLEKIHRTRVDKNWKEFK